MATIRAFRALRPAKGYEGKVIALPYDVMNRGEAAEMAAGNPFSFLRVSRAEIGFPESQNPYSPDVYQKGKETLSGFVEDGVLIREKKPMLYVYRQVMGGRQQTGLVCCVAVDEYLNGAIRKHEFTRVDKEMDRISHFDACEAHTEPVFLAYREDAGIRGLIESAIEGGSPEYDITAPDGIRHIMWLVPEDGAIQAIADRFREIPNLYIADGHHRSAAACKVCLTRREADPNYRGDEEFNFFLAVVFPDRELRIFDYNRAVKDLNGNSARAFLEKVRGAGFEAEEITGKGRIPYAPEKKNTFGMFLDEKWYKLTAKPEIIPEDPIAGLDVSILQDRILAPILGIGDPRTDSRIDFIGGIRGLPELERRVRGDMKAAFALFPVEIGDLFSVADQGGVMPPKSTWFEPKLGSGLFAHELSPPEGPMGNR